MDLETILLIKAFKMLDAAEEVKMDAYWQQFDKSELDAMHGVDDREFEEADCEYNEERDLSDPCWDCPGCGSCLGVAL